MTWGDVRRNDKQGLAMHILISEKFPDDFAPAVEHAKENIKRWGWDIEVEEGGADRYMVLWCRYIQNSPESVRTILLSGLDDEEAVYLRSCSPFSGLIENKERWDILENYDDFISGRGYED